MYPTRRPPIGRLIHAALIRAALIRIINTQENQ